MGQRWIAALVAGGLFAALLVTALAVPLPYAVYSPGPTFDVLGEDADEAELIQVDGSEVDVYYDEGGQIRFTTVESTARGYHPSLPGLFKAWLDPDEAVIPYEIAHPPNQSAEQEQQQGQRSMATSQQVATAVALTELGYELPTSTQVIQVSPDAPAEGVLLTGDVFLRAGGKKVRTNQDVVDAVVAHEPGDPVSFRVRRDGKKLDVEIAPADVDGESRIGVVVGLNYEFPFDVKVRIPDAIGGPSAGLMFSLAIYDTLTPGSLSDDEVIAGTGTIGGDGAVGPIGGIAQKIAAAEDAGARLFFVPPDNCDDVAGLDPDLELVKATTMHDARLALDAWADDRDADLPTC